MEWSTTCCRLDLSKLGWHSLSFIIQDGLHLALGEELHREIQEGLQAGDGGGGGRGSGEGVVKWFYSHTSWFAERFDLSFESARIFLNSTRSAWHWKFLRNTFCNSGKDVAVCSLIPRADCHANEEELCKAAAASEGYSLQQVRNSLTCDFSFLLTWTTLKSNNPSAMW